LEFGLSDAQEPSAESTCLLVPRRRHKDLAMQCRIPSADALRSRRMVFPDRCRLGTLDGNGHTCDASPCMSNYDGQSYQLQLEIQKKASGWEGGLLPSAARTTGL
ncbi:hypothetical protein KXV73_001077, partial [Aspergillus fumigatus]